MGSCRISPLAGRGEVSRTSAGPGIFVALGRLPNPAFQGRGLSFDVVEPVLDLTHALPVTHRPRCLCVGVTVQVQRERGAVRHG